MTAGQPTDYASAWQALFDHQQSRCPGCYPQSGRLCDVGRELQLKESVAYGLAKYKKESELIEWAWKQPNRTELMPALRKAWRGLSEGT